MSVGPDLTPKLNIEIELLTNRIVEHIEGIDKIRKEFEELGEGEYGNYPASSDASRPWREQDQERRILRQRHVDKRHQLLSHVLADLLELVSREAGLDQIDKLLYPYNYMPARRARAFKLD
jgi:pyruvate/oxaloacetate carboxyltransferase